MKKVDLRASFFPVELPGGVTARRVDRGVAQGAIAQIGAQVFVPREALGQFVPPAARRGALARAGRPHTPSSPEWIVVYSEQDEPVGWLYGYLEDAETFFIDTVGLIPAFRRRGIYTALLQHLIAYLGALGCERLTTSHHPNNRAVMIPELKAGFNIVGLELHEGCGPLIRMAYLFHLDRRQAFRSVFRLAPEPTSDTG